MSAKVSCLVLRGGERGDPRTSPDLYGEELEQLKVLWKEYGAQDYAIPKDLVNERWQLKGLLGLEGDRSYQFTHLGKILVGARTLVLFNKVQEQELLNQLASLEGSVEIAEAAGLSCLEERRADLLIYRAQLRRILVNLLYFLEVKANGTIFYKIGITTRSIEERIAQVQRDVRAHYLDVAVSLLGLWEHRGNVELYFKHRYQPFNYRIGKLTEYFVFPFVKALLQDLYEMKPKVLSVVELEAIDGMSANNTGGSIPQFATSQVSRSVNSRFVLMSAQYLTQNHERRHHRNCLFSHPYLLRR
jgi:hypothetical protein